MNLQDKIAARRRELTAEQRNAELAAEAHVAKIAAHLQNDKEESAEPVKAGRVRRRRPKETFSPIRLDPDVVGQRIEKLVEKETDRLMENKGGKGPIICLFLGILILFKSWAGLWVILAAALWYSWRRLQFKDEARKKVEDATRNAV